MSIKQPKARSTYPKVPNPPRLLDVEKRFEHLELAVLTAQFLAQGGAIQQLSTPSSTHQ